MLSLIPIHPTDSSTSFFVRAALVFVVSESILLCIFVPKIIHAQRLTKESVKNAIRRSVQRKSSDVSKLGSELAEESWLGSDVGCQVLSHPEELDTLKAEIKTLHLELSRLKGLG